MLSFLTGSKAYNYENALIEKELEIKKETLRREQYEREKNSYINTIQKEYDTISNFKKFERFLESHKNDVYFSFFDGTKLEEDGFYKFLKGYFTHPSKDENINQKIKNQIVRLSNIMDSCTDLVNISLNLKPTVVEQITQYFYSNSDIFFKEYIPLLESTLSIELARIDWISFMQ